MRNACAGEGFCKKKEGKRYCVLHYPGDEKAADFQTTLDRKLAAQDYNFRGVWFPKGVRFKELHWDGSANFSSATFNEDIDFSDVEFQVKALFNNASFNARADFDRVKFSLGADFGGARFNEVVSFGQAYFQQSANFNSASFSADANFIQASFSAVAYFNAASFSADAYFGQATFGAAASFRSARFGATASFRSARFDAVADFSSARFKDYLYFAREPKKRTLGNQPQLTFRFALFEKPDHVSFHTLELKPHWFANVDPRKFEFIDVEFEYDLKDELEKLKMVDTLLPYWLKLKMAELSAPHRLLSIACRQLADNAETNHRYHEASRLRYSSFDARRIERFYGFVFWRLDWWYWLASGYGESVSRAFIVFVMLIGLFAVGYKYSSFEHVEKTEITPTAQAAEKSSPDTPNKGPKRLGWDEAARYSINVSILQKPDPKPQSSLAKWLVIVETVLGPAQAALLALALRRRFMR